MELLKLRLSCPGGKRLGNGKIIQLGHYHSALPAQDDATSSKFTSAEKN
jgi:hypothetical protein